MATHDTFVENMRNVDDAISYTSRGGGSMAGLLNAEARFGESTTSFKAKPLLLLSKSWKPLMLVIGLVGIGLIIWSATGSQKAASKTVDIDDIQAEKIKQLEGKLNKFERKLDQESKTLEKKLNDHIGHFILSNIKQSQDAAKPIDLSFVTQIPALQTEIDKLKLSINELQSSSSTSTEGGTSASQSEINQIKDRLNALETNPQITGGAGGVSANSMAQLTRKVNTLSNAINVLKSATKGSSIGTIPKTCEDVFKDSTSLSGNYTIDPDGDGPMEPFNVFCDQTKRSTIIYHDKMTKQTINQCNAMDCYKLNMTYNQVSMDQIISLMETSESCQQKIQFDCKLSPMTNFAKWADRHNEQQTYFSGANYGKAICQCGAKNPNECFHLQGLENKCNCDQKDTTERQDIGYITNKTALPITSFSYGGMYMADQIASVTIGELECKGQRKVDLAGGSCQSLKLQGRPSGYYLLDTNNGTEQPIDTTKPVLHVSKCNMSLSSTDRNFQMDLGFLTLFTGRVNIIADITENHYVQMGARIPFDRLVMDPTNSFIMDNSTFVAPWSGVFTFNKHRFRCNNNDRDMYGYINVHDNFEIRSSDTERYLNKGDHVVITRKDSTITLGCEASDPCRLTIKGEE